MFEADLIRPKSSRRIEEEKVPEIIETPSEVKGLNDMKIGKFN